MAPVAAELPQPTDDPSQLRADLVDWGYCLVSDALSPAQLEALRRRVDRSCGRVCIKCPPSSARAQRYIRSKIAAIERVLVEAGT